MDMDKDIPSQWSMKEIDIILQFLYYISYEFIEAITTSLTCVTDWMRFKCALYAGDMVQFFLP